MDNVERWYFTKEQLANTPSRKCGISESRELSFRQQAANFIQDMGQRLQVNQLCINTAIVYMHRFYVFHSFTEIHRNKLSLSALFLAAKVEEQPRKLEHLIKVAHACLHKDQPPLDVRSEAYQEKMFEVVAHENILLQTLGFVLAIEHPHTYVVKVCQLVKASKDLAQTSYIMATTSLHMTTMCLMYKPTLVACVCIHLACKWSDWRIEPCSEGRDWFYYVDRSVTLEKLEALTDRFIAIMETSPHRFKKKFGQKDGSYHGPIPRSLIPVIKQEKTEGVSKPETSEVRPERVDVAKPERLENVKTEKVEQPKPEKSDYIKPEKTDSFKTEKMDSFKTEKMDSYKTEKIDMKIESKSSTPVVATTHKSSYIEVERIDNVKVEKTEQPKIENMDFVKQERIESFRPEKIDTNIEIKSSTPVTNPTVSYKLSHKEEDRHDNVRVEKLEQHKFEKSDFAKHKKVDSSRPEKLDTKIEIKNVAPVVTNPTYKPTHKEDNIVVEVKKEKKDKAKKHSSHSSKDKSASNHVDKVPPPSGIKVKIPKTVINLSGIVPETSQKYPPLPPKPESPKRSIKIKLPKPPENSKVVKPPPSTSIKLVITKDKSGTGSYSTSHKNEREKESRKRSHSNSADRKAVSDTPTKYQKVEHAQKSHHSNTVGSSKSKSSRHGSHRSNMEHSMNEGDYSIQHPSNGNNSCSTVNAQSYSHGYMYNITPPPPPPKLKGYGMNIGKMNSMPPLPPPLPPPQSPPPPPPPE